ncbi:MAG: hypothetical protein ACFFDU_10080 [Candidatus Thorarchaeota archaeon]
MDVEGVSISVTGVGLELFLPGTFLITFVFDVLCREDWRRGYQSFMKNDQLNDLLSNRLIQIVVVILVQFAVMSIILSTIPFSPTGDTILNDAIFLWNSWIAAQIAFFVVNIPWLLWLNFKEYLDRRMPKKLA